MMQGPEVMKNQMEILGMKVINDCKKQWMQDEYS